MSRRKSPAAKKIDPSDIEVYPTVAGFEVALRKADHGEDRKQYFEIVLRSLDRTVSHQIHLTDKRAEASRRLMDFHAGVCALQHITGVKLDRSI